MTEQEQLRPARTRARRSEMTSFASYGRSRRGPRSVRSAECIDLLSRRRRIETGVEAHPNVGYTGVDKSSSALRVRWIDPSKNPLRIIRHKHCGLVLGLNRRRGQQRARHRGALGTGRPDRNRPSPSRPPNHRH